MPLTYLTMMAFRSSFLQEEKLVLSDEIHQLRGVYMIGALGNDGMICPAKPWAKAAGSVLLLHDPHTWKLLQGLNDSFDCALRPWWDPAHQDV